jgi:hypothetical protein
VPDYTTTFRVLVVGEGQRAQGRVAELESHGWTATLTSGTSVREDAHALLPHAAVIDASDVEAAAQAGLAVRSSGTYNAVLMFVTADEQTRSAIRSRVPVPTFVTEKDYMGELWKMPEAQQYGR